MYVHYFPVMLVISLSYFLSQTNADREWKYTLTKVRIHYFTDRKSLPSPFFMIGMLLSCIMKEDKKTSASDVDDETNENYKV